MELKKVFSEILPGAKTPWEAEVKGITLENFDITEVSAEFISSDIIVQPQYINYRVNEKGQRNYARVEKGAVRYAPSWSRVRNTVIPLEPSLLKWGREKGQAEYERILMATGDYGKFLHVMFGRILRGEKFFLAEQLLKSEAELFYEENGMDFSMFGPWYKENKRSIAKDLIGFVCWVKEYNVRPVAIEYPVFAADNSIAQTIDLICRMTIDDEEVIAHVDYKTGLNAFHNADVFQLASGSRLWNEEHGEHLPVTRMFNYGCNDYRMKTLQKYLGGGKSGNFKPYRFQDQTSTNEDYTLLDLYLKIFHSLPDVMEISTRIEFDPMFSVGIESDLTLAVNEYTVEKILLQEAADEQDQKESF